MRITQQQYVELYTCINEHAIDGGILMKRAQLAEKATAALGFQVSPQKAADTAKAAGVQLICNQKRRETEPKQNDLDENAVHQRLASIESKVDALLKAWDVKCGRLV